MANKVILVGNIGNNPEVRQTGSGTLVANCSLATQEGKDGTAWHRLVFFKRNAELVQQYVTKGSKMYVEGRIQYRSWEDNEGNKKFTTEILVGRFEFLGGRGGRIEGGTMGDDAPF